MMGRTGSSLALLLTCSLTVGQRTSDASPGAMPTIVIADLSSRPELRAEATALGLLLRSVLDSPLARVVPRPMLVHALQKVTGASVRQRQLTLDAKHRVQLLKRLGASYSIEGSLARSGTRLQASVKAYNQRGKPLATYTSSAAHGGISALSTQLSTKIASTLGRPVPRDPPSPSLGQLLPFVEAAQGLVSAQPLTAMWPIRVASSEVASRIRATRDVVDMALAQTEAPLEDRILAALLARPSRLASIAEAVSAQKNATPAEKTSAAVAQSFAAMAQGKSKQARQRLKTLHGPLADYARAMLAHRLQRGKERDKVLESLISTEHFLPALALVSTLAPANISTPLLKAAYVETQGLAQGQHPAVAARIALRVALRADDLGILAEQPLKHVRLELLDTDDLEAIEPLANQLRKAGLAVGHRLVAELKLLKGDKTAEPDLRAALRIDPKDSWSRVLLARTLLGDGRDDKAVEQLALAAVDGRDTTRLEYARALELAGQTAKAKVIYRSLKTPSLATPVTAQARQLAPRFETKSAVAPPTANLRALGREGAQQLRAKLVGLLRAFPPLTDGAVHHVVLVPLAGSHERLLWPVQLHTEALRWGIKSALLGQKIVVDTSSQEVSVDALTPKGLQARAQRASSDAVLLFGARSRGVKTADVELVLYQRGQTRVLEHAGTINGRRYGLVTWNPLFIGSTILMAVAIFGWAGIRLWRGTGDVKVKIALDPATAKQALSLRLSRRKKRVTIEDPEAYSQTILSGKGAHNRYHTTRVQSFHRFTRIPAGSYYLHLYGTALKAGQRHVLPVEVRQIRVNKHECLDVHLDLVPATYELRIHVYDDEQPVAGAKIWIGARKDDARTTNRHGQVALALARGAQHTVHVSANNHEITRSVKHDDTSTHQITLNLAKERRLATLADGIGLDPQADGNPEPLEITQGFGMHAAHPQQAQQPASQPAAYAAKAAPQPPAMQPAAAASPGTVGMWGGALAQTEAAKVAPQANTPHQQTGLARYQRISELGRGAMGVVYRARDVLLERDVALKVIGEELRQHPLALQMFVQEAKALAAMNHPNVVMVFDQGQDGPNTYLVMEFVEGTTLEHAITNGGPLSLPEGLALADQLCAGIAYAHNRQILHRDIKPENIFLSGNGAVKIGDFGLARVMRELSIQRTAIRGTPLYMAPEQIRGKDIDLRADIYALGCTLFSVFAGRPPFTQGEILYHHLHTDPPRPSDFTKALPAELDQVILTCIAKDKSDRMASAIELRRALEPIQRRFS